MDTKNDRVRFIIDIMEKMNGSEDIFASVPDILCDLCNFFGFGCGFVYTVDYEDTFHLTDRFALYKTNTITDEMRLKELLSETLYDQLAHTKVVSFRAKLDMSALELRLAEIFGASSLLLVPITDAAGKMIAFIGISDRRGNSRVEDEDLTYTYSVLCTIASNVKLRLYQERIENAHATLDNILNNMGIDVYVNDFSTHEILYANRSMAEPYGGVDNMIGKTCWQFLYEGKEGECEYCPRKMILDEEGHPTKMYSWDYKRPFDGSWFRVLSTAFNWTDGRLAQVVASVDITENKRNEEIIREMVEYDMLTKLPNHRKMTQDCDRVIDELGETGGSAYVLFFDLDDFKKVNDSLGHNLGNELLIQIGQCVKSHPLIGERCYRYGGDEFLILCDDGRGNALAHVKEIIEFLLKRFSEPWELEGKEVICRTSIGVSAYPADAQTANTLINTADMAMYEAKSAGKGMAKFYSRGDYCSPEEYYQAVENAKGE